MKEVLVTAPDEHLEFIKASVLTRPDVRVRVESNIERSIQSLFLATPDLYIIYDNIGTSLPGLLSELLAHSTRVPSSIVVLTDKSSPSDFPKFIKLILPTNVDIKTFNDLISGVLKFPGQRSTRHEIRIGLSLAQSSGSIFATTVNICGPGMLVESTVPLTLGQVYELRFMGAKGAAGSPTISAKVLRQENAMKIGVNTKLYATEFVGVSSEQVEALVANLSHEKPDHPS
jgi:hypothetical protein